MLFCHKRDTKKHVSDFFDNQDRTHKLPFSILFASNIQSQPNISDFLFIYEHFAWWIHSFLKMDLFFRFIPFII